MEKVIVIGNRSDFHKQMKALLGLRYNLDHVYSEVEAHQVLSKNTFDLCILEKDLADSGCINLCMFIRNDEKTFTIPIIVIAEESTAQDRVMAFSVGANDFITSTCPAVELCARVATNVQFRKALTRTKKNTNLGPFSIDLEAQSVRMLHDNVTSNLDLTRIEFKIFVYLFTNDGKLRTRDQIRGSIWGQNVFVDSRTIDKHVSTLRRKMAPYEKCIQTTAGLGYALLEPKDESLESQQMHSA